MKLFNKSLAKKAATAAIVAAMSFGAVALPAASAGQPQDQVPLLRLYNPYSGEHLFTTNRYEASDLVFRGWRSERSDGLVNLKEGTPVFRLYNEWTGDHHYTSDTNEVNACIKQGWTNEGIQFCSDEDATTDVYSMYNPYATKFYHLYTADADEMAKMQSDGWRQENVKWRVITDGRSKVVAPVEGDANANTADVNGADANGTNTPSMLPFGQQSGDGQSAASEEYSFVSSNSSSSTSRKKKIVWRWTDSYRWVMDDHVIHGNEPDVANKTREYAKKILAKGSEQSDKLIKPAIAKAKAEYEKAGKKFTDADALRIAEAIEEECNGKKEYATNYIVFREYLPFEVEE